MAGCGEVASGCSWTLSMILILRDSRRTSRRKRGRRASTRPWWRGWCSGVDLRRRRRVSSAGARGLHAGHAPHGPRRSPASSRPEAQAAQKNGPARRGDQLLTLGTSYLRQLLNRFGRARGASSPGGVQCGRRNGVRPDGRRSAPACRREEFAGQHPRPCQTRACVVIRSSLHVARALPPPVLSCSRARRPQIRRRGGGALSFRIGDFKPRIDPALLKREGRTMRSDGRSPDQIRPVTIQPRYSKHAEGLGADRGGRHPRDLHGQRRGPRAPCSSGARARAGSPRSTGAAAAPPRPAPSASRRRAALRTHPRDPARLIGRSLRTHVGPRRPWASEDALDRLRRPRRPTAARAPPPSPVLVALVEALRHLKKQGAFIELACRRLRGRHLRSARSAARSS